ncbi:MAG: hypothetical protein NUV77_16530 [Thermoguttaceae bacterium]|jgi:hypothetical protein|nr:hypothetical protein [Thermoguttaceae bacterium]
MHTAAMSVHAGLAQGTRLPSLAHGRQRLHKAEVAFLVGAGVAAALATTFLEWRLRIPGHAILRAVFPMALGLAVVPRRMGGSLMGLSAAGSATLLQAAGAATVGLGAITSLTVLGPLLDAALWRAPRGWRLYAGFALAGLGANLAALGVRAGAKAIGLDHLAARPLAEWWLQAAVSYALCGLLAGLLSAAVCFRLAESARTRAEERA